MSLSSLRHDLLLIDRINRIGTTTHVDLKKAYVEVGNAMLYHSVLEFIYKTSFAVDISRHEVLKSSSAGVYVYLQP